MAEEDRELTPRRIESSILLIRGERVMLDQDLAALYGVETGALNRAVMRHRDRFPKDFMFQLTAAEFADLKCQLGIASGWGGRRTPPYAFTEQGVAMLSSVLNSPRAVKVNIEIMRTFVKVRAMLTEHAELKRKLSDLEHKYDAQFKVVFTAIRKLMDNSKSVPARRQIGFRSGEGE